ncbi:hypothetical protein QCM80_29900 [Bradyrhizobium sp. SSUT112]|uniref:hypothetical protein n=1 Tax=Bradyrhizobium sp. SSUT112 TaxID=3040604 RepID=UPI00244C0616|nr:hypothetical protein [Bradyrhizobium sp. SSUT112]MDH2354849.1 hypothetical protein [Bradyrhizobium sp. SSUT112]
MVEAEALVPSSTENNVFAAPPRSFAITFRTRILLASSVNVKMSLLACGALPNETVLPPPVACVAIAKSSGPHAVRRHDRDRNTKSDADYRLQPWAYC